MRALSRFDVSDMIASSAELRRLGDAATSFEDVATRVVRHLHETLCADDGSPATVLVRCYKTHAAELLDPPSRRFADQVLGGLTAPGTKCLTLFGTVGVEPAWCDRTASVHHRAIPLPSAELVERFPMISGLMTQMGVDVPQLLEGEPSATVTATDGTPYNVFHVRDAAGSPFVPEQAGFVELYGVRSALGFGGDLATGDIFAVILFSRVAIPARTAALFRALALAVKIAVMPFAAGPYYSSESSRVLVHDRSTFRLARASVVEQLLAVQEETAAQEAGRLRAGDDGAAPA